MASRVSIKDAIEVLSQLLCRHGFPKIQAETIRQAKHERGEAVMPLLTLTYKILTFKLNENELPPCTEWYMYLFILSVLKELDYPNLDYMVCDSMSALSSKELLLAFGFLIDKLELIDCLKCNAERLITDEFFQACSIGTQRAALCLDSLNHLLRTKKLIDLKHRALLSSAGYFDKLVSKFELVDSLVSTKEISDETVASKSSATILDLIFYDNVRIQEQMTALLKRQIDLLRLHIKWMKHEHLFWKWLLAIRKEPAKFCGNQTPGTKSKKLFTRDLVLCSLERLKHSPVGNCGALDSVAEKKPPPDFVAYFIERSLNDEIKFPQGSDEVMKVSSKREGEMEAMRKSIADFEDSNRHLLSNYLDEVHPDFLQFPELKN